MHSALLFIPILLLGALTSHALDNDGSGVSDIYEEAAGRRLPAQADADGDGYSNYLESLMGTNALDAQSPGTILQRQGDHMLLTPPNIRHTRSHLIRAADLETFKSELNYYQNNPTLITPTDGEGNGGGEFPTLGDGETTVFYTVLFIPPLDTDSDGLDDYEESLLGTSIELADSDYDQLDDLAEYRRADTDPHDPDTDDDGFLDGDEVAAGSGPGDPVTTPVTASGQAWSNVYQLTNSGNRGTASKQAWSNAYVIRNEGNYGTYARQAWSNAYVIQNNASADEPL